LYDFQEDGGISECTSQEAVAQHGEELGEIETTGREADNAADVEDGAEAEYVEQEAERAEAEAEHGDAQAEHGEAEAVVDDDDDDDVSVEDILSVEHWEASRIVGAPLPSRRSLFPHFTCEMNWVHVVG
jgi:hypothetical protein